MNTESRENTTLEIQGTNVLNRNLAASRRFVINEGGTRSSKTYSLCQLFIVKMLSQEKLVISVVRKTMPSLRSSAMKDFFHILKEYGLYREEQHNKSENIYRLGSSEIEFFSVDQPQKVRGRKRDFLWLNEANELSIEDFRQLNWRTGKQVFMDYNPSEEESWIYELIEKRPAEVDLLKSTFLDNIEFLPEEIRTEIELLKVDDPENWTIYGLGERGHRSNIIYRPYTILPVFPDSFDDEIYGLDFGFNNPTALLHIGFKDRGVYLREKLYEPGLTNQQLIVKMERLVPDKKRPIYGDAEDKNRIEEIYNAGFNIHPADKGADSVIAGIQLVRGLKCYSLSSNVNLNKERAGYQWKKDKNGKLLDEPIKFKDHLLDAKRYALYTHLKAQMKPQKKLVIA